MHLEFVTSDELCRFWQARAVESFLRGATSYADQMFLLKRGLLEVSDPDSLYTLSLIHRTFISMYVMRCGVVYI